MNASDPIKIIKEFLRGGGRPHMAHRCRRRAVTSSKPPSTLKKSLLIGRVSNPQRRKIYSKSRSGTEFAFVVYCSVMLSQDLLANV